MSYPNIKNNKINFLPGIALFIFISVVIGMAACTKMNDTYHDFWKSGEKVYPEAPDSLKVFPGENRIALRWLLLGDPTVSKAIISWNNGKDSLEVPIERKGVSHVDTIRVMLNDMPEGTYNFEIYIYDEKGNRSVSVNAVGRVYGEAYMNSLLFRIVSSALFVNDTLKIIWGDPSDRTAIGSKLTYTDTTDATRHLQVAPDADTTVIADFDFNASHYFTYRTLFLPDSMAIDTFYTKYDTVQVLGPRAELPKTGWIATASSYDQRHGDDRKPFSAIDNNEGTIWVNQISPQLDYPHSLTIDMGAVQNNIYGISVSSNGGGETPSNASIYISNDGTTWQLTGLFSIEKAKGTQYLDFSAPQSFRYVKAEFGSSYGSKNIIINEMGVYTR